MLMQAAQNAVPPLQAIPTDVHRYITFGIVLAFPTMIAVAGALGRKLIRGTDFRRSDFFIGPDLALGAISAGLVNLLEVAQSSASVQSLPISLFFTAAYTAVTFFLFIVILTLHQVWERRDTQPNRQILSLGIASNAIGLSLLVLFLWLKLHGDV